MKGVAMKKLHFYFPVFLFFFALAQTDINKKIMEGDSLYNLFNFKEACNSYQEAYKIDSCNYDLNWKSARVYIDLGESFENNKERKANFKKGEIFARRAIQIDSTGSKGHLYLSIALGRIALDASAKERIQLSKEIKKEVDLAIAYNPNDDIAYHVLGRWNRKLANLNWIERGFANLFLGGVPKEASNENALKCFLKSIELNPNHINHHLELAMTYESMKQKEKAIEEYQKCLELPETDSEDDQHKKTAQQRLKKLNKN
jgi:tetratricopeptide (TPR) repeat protein